jgi:predicted nucleic acid-binding Zn ribbon protein
MAPRFHPEDKGPTNLADVLGPLFAARGWGRKSERVRLEGAWAEAAGPAAAAESRVVALRRGVLEVEVRAGVLLQELAQFRKRELLAALRLLLTNVPVTDLKFRAGAW